MAFTHGEPILVPRLTTPTYHEIPVPSRPALPLCSRSFPSPPCPLPYSDSYALRLDTLFHELGHNSGLLHSTTPGNEYGDCSCAMWV